ncbi:MAG: hypothetical protein P8J27_04785 [Mariniblastus sp.]|nr:hypothetical protein [Mariniblastus sp.]
MKAATLHELRQNLVKLDHGEILDACVRLARFKKDNKELLTYLLFQSQNESGYVNSVCQEMDALFKTINSTSLYLAKKTIRKIVRWLEKRIKYSGINETEIALRLHFCNRLNSSGIRLDRSKVIFNMFQSQLKKVDKTVHKFHPDIQAEYQSEIEQLKKGVQNA